MYFQQHKRCTHSCPRSCCSPLLDCRVPHPQKVPILKSEEHLHYKLRSERGERWRAPAKGKLSQAKLNHGRKGASSCPSCWFLFFSLAFRYSPPFWLLAPLVDFDNQSAIGSVGSTRSVGRSDTQPRKKERKKENATKKSKQMLRLHRSAPFCSFPKTVSPAVASTF